MLESPSSRVWTKTGPQSFACAPKNSTKKKRLTKASSQSSALSSPEQHNNFLSLLSHVTDTRRLSQPISRAMAVKVVRATSPQDVSPKPQPRFGTKPSNRYGFSTDPSIQGPDTECVNEEAEGASTQQIPDARPQQLQAALENPDIEKSSQGTSQNIRQQSENPLPQICPAAARDKDLDALISNMSQHMVIKDIAVTIPKAFQVPKGYLMDLETKASDFYLQREQVRTHMKRKRKQGVIPKLSRREWRDERHGFRAQEVIRSGAVSLEKCRPCNLTNDIHPLLDQSRFDDTPDAIYDQLIPGLRLASMLLSHPACMQFWVTLALGQREDDDEMGKNYGKHCQRIKKHVTLTEENSAKTIKHLEELGKSNLIRFAFRHKLHDKGLQIWGNSGPICDYLGVRKSYGVHGNLSKCIIRLHADNYILAKKLSQLKYPEVSQQLRFHFFFAILIMHELAHSIEGAYIKMRHEQWIEFQRSKTYTEPFWLDWTRPPECGKAWESTMFGGEVLPINQRVDCSHGIGTSDWPPRGHELDPERRVWFTAPMVYIESLFQTSTWCRKYDLANWRHFHIPRDGAISLYINSFTTMAPAEQRRAQNEELAEIVATTSEQPAKKKRIRALGEAEEQRPEERAAICEAVTNNREAEDPNERIGVPTFRGTRRLSSVMTGALSSSAIPPLDGQSLEGSKGPSPVPEGKEPTSELIMRISAQPLGGLNRYVERRRKEGERKKMEGGKKEKEKEMID